MQNPSIVIYTFIYNAAHFFTQLLSSVKNVNYDNFEWLIVDDGSTDDIEELINKASKTVPFKIIYYKKENGGKLLGYKYLQNLLDKYEYAFCLDADDEIMPDSLKIGIQTFVNLSNEYWCVDGRLVD